jgi:hypothetical protein
MSRPADPQHPKGPEVLTMTDCHDSDRGEPVAALGYAADELSILAITRHYCASFAMPKRQSWIAAISVALSKCGDDRGPVTAVAVLGVLQSIRRIRRSHFRFNVADCAACSTRITGHERLLMNALRAVRRDRGEAAEAHATLLCEGNDACPVVRALAVLAERAFAHPAPVPAATPSMQPAPSAGA